MKTFAATLVIAIVITLTGFAISPAVALADAPAPQYQVFFPVVFGPPPAPAPLPTPLPPTSPVTGTVQTLWPTKAVSAAGQWQDYSSAMSGTGNVSGNDIFSSGYTPQNAVYSLINQLFFGLIYRINRIYVEFDTTTVPANFETAQFNFTIYMPYSGPPAHYVNVYRGTWADGGLTDADGQFLTQSWQSYELTPLAILPGGDPTVSAWQPVTVTLPREVINPGGITRLVFRSTAEGTPPLTQLGGAFSGLSLTVK